LGVTRSTTNPLVEITTAHAVGLPPALLPAPDRSHVTVRSGRLQGGLDNNAARNPPACLTDRSPARRVRGVEYRNVLSAGSRTLGSAPATHRPPAAARGPPCTADGRRRRARPRTRSPAAHEGAVRPPAARSRTPRGWSR
jgi:hypothetical protein